MGEGAIPRLNSELKNYQFWRGLRRSGKWLGAGTFECRGGGFFRPALPPNFELDATIRVDSGVRAYIGIPQSHLAFGNVSGNQLAFSARNDGLQQPDNILIRGV